MLYSAHITITNNHDGLGTYLSPLSSTKDRSRIGIAEDPEVVRLSVEAADCPAFRAAINTVTQALSVFETVKNP